MQPGKAVHFRHEDSAHLQLVVGLRGELVHAAHHRPQPKSQLLRRNAFLGTELLQGETPDLGGGIEPERPLKEPHLWGYSLSVVSSQ